MQSKQRTEQAAEIFLPLASVLLKQNNVFSAKSYSKGGTPEKINPERN